jgi:hypothetical protein
MSDGKRCHCGKFDISEGCGRREFNRARTVHLPAACGPLSDPDVRTAFLFFRWGPLLQRLADSEAAESKCGVDGCTQPKGHP